jgi:hypothetical protein
VRNSELTIALVLFASQRIFARMRLAFERFAQCLPRLPPHATQQAAAKRFNGDLLGDVNTAASAAVIVIITITTITAKIIIIISVVAATAVATCLHLLVVLQRCIIGTRHNIQLKCFSASQASPLSHSHQNHDQYRHHLSLMTFFFLPTTKVSSPMAMAIPST